MLLLLLLVLVLPADAETLRIDSSTGTLLVLLEKEGPLRALGHDHVVRAPAFDGSVELSSGSAQLALTIDAQALTIDRPEERRAQNWSAIAQSDLPKIAASMQGPSGLDVLRFPTIRLVSQSIEPVEGEKDTWLVTGHFTLHGATQTVDFPVVMTDGLGGRWFSGYVRLRPSDYGVKPFSMFLGGLRVKDEAVVRFSLFGRR
jgi:polyisoprenoid-binding protein YceI